MTIEFILNGQSVKVEPRADESLLETLRERCGILSTKDGCSPQGQCGCCLAIVGGRAVTTCAMPASTAAGQEILTLEGLPEAERKQMTDAFVAAAGLQCGFCIPGIMVRTKHLLDKSPDPSRDEIAKAIDTHLCRCTGYVKIIDAVELLARARRGEAVPKPQYEGGVGERVARYRGADLALGERPYVADLRRDGMLFGALALSAHARHQQPSAHPPPSSCHTTPAAKAGPGARRAWRRPCRSAHAWPGRRSSADRPRSPSAWRAGRQ